MAETPTPPGAGGVSRRGFLKGLGVSGAGAAVAGMIEAATAAIGPETAAAESTPVLKGPGEVPITLNINGETHQLRLEPRTTLLDALRNRLDLTGAKKVCDRGTCGACTVHVDGKAVYACSMLAIEAEGHAIRTIEGLGSPDNMHPVQAAFVRHDAQQCGFCTPGFVMACAAFLEEHPKATLRDMQYGLGGNLCRCGTYAGIHDAMAELTGLGKEGA